MICDHRESTEADLVLHLAETHHLVDQAARAKIEDAIRPAASAAAPSPSAPHRTTSTVGAGVKIGFGMFIVLPLLLFFGGCFVFLILASMAR